MNRRNVNMWMCYLAAASTLAASGPTAAVADTLQTKPAPCGSGGFELVEIDGMAWSTKGRSPSELAKMPPDEVGAYSGTWAAAYEAAGIGSVVLAGLARDLSSWGAVEPVDGGTFGKYNLGVLDAVVRSFGGSAVLVLSAENPWDHQEGAAPVDEAAFRDYVRAVVERYDGDTDFAISAQDPSYPDIDYSGQVVPADWDATKPEKQAWASEHIAAAYMVETDVPEDPSASYAAVLRDVLEVAVKADKNARVWVAPFPVSRFNRPKLEAWLTEFAVDGGPADGLDALVVTLPDGEVDFTARTGFDSFEDVRKWVAQMGFAPGEPGGARMVLGATVIGNAPDACPQPQCSEQAQSEWIVKALSLAASSGANAFAFAGAFEPSSQPSGAGIGALSPDGDPPVLSPERGMITARAVSKLLTPGASTVEWNTGIPATHVVSSEPCDGVGTAFAWYDWTLEVGPGEPYGDLAKSINIDEKPDLSMAFALTPPDTEPIDLSGGGVENEVGLPAGQAEPSPDGGVTLKLGRTPQVLVTLAGGWPVDVPDAAPDAGGEVTTPDAAEGEDVPDGGGDCSAGRNSASGLPLLALLLFLALARSFRWRLCA